MDHPTNIHTSSNKAITCYFKDDPRAIQYKKKKKAYLKQSQN